MLSDGPAVTGVEPVDHERVHCNDHFPVHAVSVTLLPALPVAEVFLNVRQTAYGAVFPPGPADALFPALPARFSPRHGQMLCAGNYPFLNDTELVVFLAEQSFQLSNACRELSVHLCLIMFSIGKLQHFKDIKAGGFWLVPVQFVEEHGKLRTSDRDFTVPDDWPDEMTIFEASCVHTQPICICPEDFLHVTTSATEDKEVPGAGIFIQLVLYLLTQAIEVLTHSSDTGNQPAPCFITYSFDFTELILLRHVIYIAQLLDTAGSKKTGALPLLDAEKSGFPVSY